MVLVVASNGLFAALSTSCLLSFLLTVVHFPFFLNSCCIFSYTTAAAADRTFMVTLMISETVSVFFVFMPLPL